MLALLVWILCFGCLVVVGGFSGCLWLVYIYCCLVLVCLVFGCVRLVFAGRVGCVNCCLLIAKVAVNSVVVSYIYAVL